MAPTSRGCCECSSCAGAHCFKRSARARSARCARSLCLSPRDSTGRDVALLPGASRHGADDPHGLCAGQETRA
eukprot:3121157-Rhodomonas_salina.1